MRIIVAGAATMLLFAAIPAYAQALSFQNESSYVNEARILHVLGEIHNESDSPVQNVLITASFYDSDGVLLNEYTRAPKIRVIDPGAVAPFEMRYLDSSTVDLVASYSLSVIGASAESKPRSLEILSVSSRLDVFGLYFINVEARNAGVTTITNPVAIATLYDQEGRVVAIGEAVAEDAGRVTEVMVPGQSAGFGIVVTERLQTYKTDRYSLVIDSDQYMSERVVLRAAGIGVSSGTDFGDPRSACLIATAAFGSELAPQVQLLRNFRDDIALNTMAGSSFMTVFNSWYYSFSPQVADFERNQPWFRDIVRISIYPLLGILGLSTTVYDSLAFNSEAAIVSAGLVASALIGLLYFAPLSAVLALQSRRMSWDVIRAKYAFAVAWTASLALVAVGQLSGGVVLMAGTALLVLSTISTVILAVVRFSRL